MYLLIASVLTLWSSHAHAIPIFAENAAQNVNTALTLYPDSEDQNLYYFMPNSSSLQMTNTTPSLPMFGFTYWGLNTGASLENAGAYLSFTAHLVSDEAQKAALNSFISGGKRVAALPIQTSIVNLTSSQKDAIPLKILFNELDFSAHAGMAEDDIGVNAVLTGIGAKVFKAAIDTPDLMKVDYCYQSQGLGPDFNAHVMVDYRRVYDDFQSHFSAGGFFWHAQIDAEIEKLIANHAISIVINGGDAKEEEYVKSISDEIVEKLMQPHLQAVPTSAAGSGWSFASYSLKITNREELTTVHWDMMKRDNVIHEACIPVTLSGLKPYYNDIVKNADATN